MADYSKFDNLTTFVCIQGVEKKPQKKNPEKFFYVITGYTRETQENFSANTFHASFVADTERKVTFSVKGEYLNIEPAKEGEGEEQPKENKQPTTNGKAAEPPPLTVIQPQSNEIAILPSDSNVQMLLAKAEIESAISTAKAFPRSLTKFLQDAETLVSLDEETAKSCSYSLPVGGSKRAEGGSIRLAEIISSTYGNIRVDVMIAEIAEKFVVAKWAARDLESNNFQSGEVRAPILYDDGRRYNDHMIRTTCNATCSKGRRNGVFAIVPRGLVDRIRGIAKKVAGGDLATLPTRVATAIKWFKNQGITESQILEKLDLEKVGDIGIDEYLTLQGYATAINDGEVTAKDIFNPSKESKEQAASVAGDAFTNITTD